MAAPTSQRKRACSHSGASDLCSAAGLLCVVGAGIVRAQTNADQFGAGAFAGVTELLLLYPLGVWINDRRS